MKAWLRNPVGVTVRLLWLGGVLVLGAWSFLRLWTLRSKETFPATRGLWLQSTARRLLHIFGLEPQFIGVIPSKGLLVCNHLSYLDIVVLAAGAPAVFVAKSEVKSWPVFGWFASRAGTIFVKREKPAKAGQFANEIEAALNRGALVILFPEGTSSDGRTVLPFKSSLLEPAVRQPHLISAAFIHYDLAGGDVAEEVCYWKDMTLLPHLINLLSKRGLRVSVRFSQLHEASANRKQLARQLHSEVTRLMESGAMANGAPAAGVFYEASRHPAGSAHQHPICGENCGPRGPRCEVPLTFINGLLVHPPPERHEEDSGQPAQGDPDKIQHVPAASSAVFFRPEYQDNTEGVNEKKAAHGAEKGD
jgi:1-acyl-sn-glycerol-3-phosphate acyltransferase